METLRQSQSVHPGLRLLLVAGSLFLLCLIQLSVSSDTAQASGRIEGFVYDAKADRALVYANILVVGTQTGAMTMSDGGFSISPLEPGTYELQVTYVGYETLRQTVELKEGETLQVIFRLEPTEVRTKEVTIRADRPLVDVKRASTIRSFNEEELRAMALEPTLDSVIEQVPGVTIHNDKIHIRGGRTDETLLIVDGVEMRDLLSGQSQAKMVTSKAVSEVNVITGGYEAKYGQALSGIIEAKLKEGSEKFKFFLGHTTDYLLGDRRIEFHELQVSGPMKVIPGEMTYFLSLSADLQDDYVPTISDRPDGDKMEETLKDIQPYASQLYGDNWLERIAGQSRYNRPHQLRSSYTDRMAGQSFRYENFFYPKANNDWRLLFKTGWRVTESDKLSLIFTKSLSFNQGYSDQSIFDTSPDKRSYPWSWALRPGHYYTYSTDQNSLSLSWKKGITPNLSHTLTATRFFYAKHKDVNGQAFADYDPIDDFDIEELNRDLPVADQYPLFPYFRDYGDATGYEDRSSESWSLASAWGLMRGRHKYEWGFTHSLDKVQALTLDAETISNSDPLGKDFDLFRAYPASGSMYAQDRIEYESLIAGIGLRYDYFFPGAAVERLYDNWEDEVNPTINEVSRDDFIKDTHSIFGRRFKGHLSPRLYASHPILSNTHIFFNYGHFSQRLALVNLYRRTGSLSGELYPVFGNPNLNPKISVQYEIGAGHQFRPDLAAKGSVFFKDGYDYPRAYRLTLKERVGTLSNYLVYVNRDFHRSTGVELELRKRRLRHWSGGITYTYSVTRGKTSNPNSLKFIQETGGDSREVALGEIYMPWNRPHKVTLFLNVGASRGEEIRLFGVKLPEAWSLNLYTLIQSGVAYTRESITGEEISQKYSVHGPAYATTDLKLRKDISLFGLDLEGSFEIRNLFNYEAPQVIDPVSGKGVKAGEGQYWSYEYVPEYFDLPDEELVRLEGIFDPEDLDADQVASRAKNLRERIVESMISLANPDYYSAPRSFRIGLGFEW